MLSDDRRRRWRELEELLERAEKKGLDQLSVPEVKRLGQLYRHVAIDLSRARTEAAHPDLLRSLNSLAGRAHGQVYRARPIDLRPALSFLPTGFPRLVRRHYAPLLIAALVFVGTALVSAAGVAADPSVAYTVFDPDLVEYENLRLEKQEGKYKPTFPYQIGISSLEPAYVIIFNNVFKALRLFAFGALFCLPGLLLLVYNGRMLGMLEGMMLAHGYFLDFNALVLTHGVLELAALCIAGGGGLLLGWAVIAPGPLPRPQALQKAAGDAFGLLAGSVVLLVLAGIIEGYITPHFGQTVRWTVAVASAVLLAAYLTLAGRDFRALIPPRTH
jgi:uncharacterized membrane protein SpoIIM required for sporulation